MKRHVRDMLVFADLDDPATRLALSDACLDADMATEAALLRDLSRPVDVTCTGRVRYAPRAHFLISYSPGHDAETIDRVCVIWDTPADRSRLASAARTTERINRVDLLHRLKCDLCRRSHEPRLEDAAIGGKAVIDLVHRLTDEWIVARLVAPSGTTPR